MSDGEKIIVSVILVFSLAIGMGLGLQVPKPEMTPQERIEAEYNRDVQRRRTREAQERYRQYQEFIKDRRR